MVFVLLVLFIVQCERCEIWYCHTCSIVTEQLIEFLVDCNEVHWFCNNYNAIAVEAIHNFFGKSNVASSTVLSETYKSAVESITSALKHLDEEVIRH